MKKYSWNLFWQFWPQIAKYNSSKVIEIGSIAKICFAKFNFSSDTFVYLAVTVEQLYNSSFYTETKFSSRQKSAQVKKYFINVNTVTCCFFHPSTFFCLMDERNIFLSSSQKKKKKLIRLM